MVRMSDDEADEPDWEAIARLAVYYELAHARSEAEESVGRITDRVHCGREVDPDDVIAARRALNELRDVLERQVAPIAGLEPWGDPPVDDRRPLGAEPGRNEEVSNR
jgi:hypothetical protein